jgi:sec-independent protein translocase protein TatB
MFDIGWSELLVIGSIALIVVGPKDLPGLLRTLGKYAAQARGMAREFQRSMEEAAREADISNIKELREASDELRNLKTMRFDTPSKKAKAAGAAARTSAAAAGAAAAKPAAEPAPEAAPAAAEAPQTSAPDPSPAKADGA